ncbi:MAG: hypothetical protein OXC80_13355 [Gammaproteobacteria bacterium]|nr:hypothetical protein [Gammaproteobacteria bacterium]
MRTFWEIESDSRVGQVISDMLDEHEAHCQLGEVEVDTTILTKVREITHRLTNNHNVVMSSRSVDDFLAREFTIPDLEKLPVDLSISNIIRSRLDEAQSVLRVGACLSAIILWGSVLEAVLLGSAQEDPVRFNKAKASPKTLGTVKPFNNWNLSQFIDVAYEIGIIGPDVKEFSQGLREFRNFIHPKKQLESNFKPDDHTAGISFQVLKAALADLTGNRGQERDQT